MSRLGALLPAPLGRAFRLIGAVARGIGTLNLGLIAAGVAFYGLLAIFPALTALVALWGFFADPEVVREEMRTFESLVPVEVFAMLQSQVSQLAAGPKTTLQWATVVSLAATLWAARSGVGALIGGLNAVYRTEARGGVWPVVMALFLTGALLGVALVALAVTVLAPVALAFLPLGPLADLALNALRWLVGGAVVLVGIGLLYRYGPNRPARMPRDPWLSAGAVVAVALWVAASVGFSFYLSNFASYNEVYGSLGAVIALLMWFWLSAYAVLLGALVNAERARLDHPAVVGPVIPPPAPGAARRAAGNPADGADVAPATPETT